MRGPHCPQTCGQGPGESGCRHPGWRVTSQQHKDRSPSCTESRHRGRDGVAHAGGRLSQLSPWLLFVMNCAFPFEVDSPQEAPPRPRPPTCSSRCQRQRQVACALPGTGGAQRLQPGQALRVALCALPTPLCLKPLLAHLWGLSRGEHSSFSWAFSFSTAADRLR